MICKKFTLSSGSQLIEKQNSITFERSIEKKRIASIDSMRGIVMIIMALDHTRDYFHADAFLYEPTDLDKTHPLLFFTRIVTHFCAPTFVLLSGISASISLQRKSVRELSLFLLTRGLWLIILELTVVRFSLLFNLYYDFIIFQVIWVIGASMVVLAALIYLPQRIVLGVGLILIFGHNILDMIQIKPDENGYLAWTFFQQAGSVVITPENLLFIPYPLLPWLGIMLAGYGIGFIYHPTFDKVKRRKVLLSIGLISILLFVGLRYFNWYGDASHWSLQKNGVFTLMSFVNVTKYPVSLLYTLMTLGPVMIVLPWMEKWRSNILEPARIIGSVPLFYYILHFFLIHFTSLCIYTISTGVAWSELDFHSSKGFGGIPPGTGYTLGWVYLAWISIVISLYPLCKWYYQYKKTHAYRWLSYL